MPPSSRSASSRGRPRHCPIGVIRCITHTLSEIIAALVFGISCRYEDGIDQNALRTDPALKTALWRCPETGPNLASQSTVSRFDNAPTEKDAAKLAGALVDHVTHRVAPGHRDVFDIDDSFHAAYGGQQLTFCNAHHDERGFASMHIYHAGLACPSRRSCGLQRRRAASRSAR